MKKVLGISCGRKNGNGEILMKEAMMAIQENCEAECSYVRLLDATIEFCTGCETCMINKTLKNNWEFRCVTPAGKDHMYFLEQLCREADAIIFAAPIYNIMPSGILIQFLNKLHATGDYRAFVAQNPKIGATIGIGGSDWVNFMQPIMNMTASEFVGGFHRVVDNLIEGFHPAPQCVLADDEIMARAHKLGENVAKALNDGDTSWKGEEGLCPICHGTLLERRGDELICPMCDIALADCKDMKFEATQEAIDHSRFSAWGMDDHLKIIGNGHKKAMQKKDIVAERRGKYASYLSPVELPELNK